MIYTMKRSLNWIFVCLVSLCFLQPIVAAEHFVATDPVGFVWIQKGEACTILVDKQEDKGVLRAVTNLQTDAQKVTGVKPELSNAIAGKRMLIIGSLDSSVWIKQLIQSGKISADDLQGKNEPLYLRISKLSVLIQQFSRGAFVIIDAELDLLQIVEFVYGALDISRDGLF